MTEVPSPNGSAEADATDAAVDQKNPNPELARVIEARVLQGYRVESLSEARAVLVVKGRKRLFGLRAGEDQRTELRMRDHGRVTTRNL
jgi:hypothetical protein